MARTRSTSPAPGNGALNPMLPALWRVRRSRKETADTSTLELGAGGGGPRFGAFAPGQFNMLYVHGLGEVPISISGDPSDSSGLVHTVRAVGAVSRAIVKMKPGDYIGVRGPYGSSWPVEAAAGMDVMIVAGGIGLAPLRPAIYSLLAGRKRYGRLVLHYGARTPAEMLYRRELEAWRARFDFDVGISVDRAGSDWRGHVGVVTTLLPKARFDPSSAFALVCGPEIMMRFAVMELQKLGVPDERIFISMERNMKCGIGLCGHCQYGPKFVCRDGPVFSYGAVSDLFTRREL
jgi:NAD(P)H-flavin reductase